MSTSSDSSASSPAGAADFHRLGREKYVEMTTFRKNGVPVRTPVWIGAGNGDLVVFTAPDSGKVKRIRNNGAVELAPCGRRGEVDPDVVRTPGRARIITDPDEQQWAYGRLAESYPFAFRALTFVGAVATLGRRKRCWLRISPVGAAD
ncbi:PPOX class F420-dependent oxidoreductase [Nakamurella flava]|nr:PPOX class F420-dependent oxidoreductase [Nakamurella flava]